MCGICGVFNRKGMDQSVVRAMAHTIRHRGPDDDGFYFGTKVGLANRRLSIIDLDTGKQPIENEDGTLHVVFNGEIYNYRALRDELVQRGHHFRTSTDTEVIVHLYEEFGAACVEKLNGMFAFAIWDERAEKLFLARDPMGQKPLYFSNQNGEFLFASEVKAILSAPGVSARLNVAAMHDCLSLRCVVDQQTLFEGIDKLPAAHTLTLHKGTVTVERYWSLNYLPKLEGTEDTIVDQLQQLLEETVESHMISDVPIGAFLSGGIDSSLIVAMMSRLSSEPINTFSIGVAESSFNELPFARMAAEAYGTNHHEMIVHSDLVATLPEMIHAMEEPVDPFAFGVYSAARLASQHVKVVLGGDGGDEMFGGYDRYVGHRLVDIYCRLPAPLRHKILEPIIHRLPDSYRYNNRVQKLRWLAAMSRSEGGRRYAESASYLRFNHDRKLALYSDNLIRELNHSNSLDRLCSYFDSANADEMLDRMLFTDVNTRLPDHLLMVGDRMTMTHSIEGRSPYVDRRVAEFAARIPVEMKIRGRRLRHVQRRVAERLLPETLIKRRKQGFSFPLAHWFKHDLRNLATNMLQKGNMVEAGYFRARAIQTLMEEHASGEVDHNYRIWLLLNFELWHRLYIDGQPGDSVEGELRERLESKSLALA